MRRLVRVGAVFAVNCVPSLERHAAAARLGVSEDEIETIARLARFITGKAALHVEALAELEDEVEAPRAATAGCR